jgi:hypothetical protein
VSGTLSRGWRAWRRASAADRLLAGEALVWLAIARLLVLLLPFRLVARLLEREPLGAPAPPPPERLHKIAWSLRAVGRRAPWRCKCLERAIAGAMMLRLRRYPATVFFGIARGDDGGALQAHAWLRCADVPVAGEDVPIEDYAVVARFSARTEGSRRA